MVADVLGRALRALVAACAIALACSAAPAAASRQVTYGIQDDAWLVFGPGTIDSRVSMLQRLGVDVVRYNLRWDAVARRRPANGRNHADAAYDWTHADTVLRGLRRHGIQAVVTLLGTPRWANGGRAFSWAPTDARWFANFSHAAAKRYPWVRMWTVWNEPNQRRWLRPTSARVYVERLLNPAYAALHAATPGMRVAGGMSAPRASAGGVSPVAWIRGVAAAGGRLDAYAHHPYPARPQVETPWAGGCGHCSTITMAELDRLVREVRRSFGGKRIWLTEYGYQTNPPDRILGVSWPTQALHVASAALRAYSAPDVDMLINFMFHDDRSPGGWQSGLFTARGQAKPSQTAFRLPLTQVERRGSSVRIWGQVRPRSGRQPFRVRRFAGGRWSWVGGTRSTDGRGFFAVTVDARSGALLQVWSPRDARFSLALRVR